MRNRIILIGLFLCLLLCGCTNITTGTEITSIETTNTETSKEVSNDEFHGRPYKILNGNRPKFTQKERTITKPFETYSKLDKLGRCGTAYVNVCRSLMPTQKRGTIGMVKPSGWHTVKYRFVQGRYLYNRCHLVGYQLAGENANRKNLITGTRYLNMEGMLSFENKIADYVERSGNHVLYRVTPIYQGQNLLANGVQMEGYSVEDHGKGICFNVYAYNAQPGVDIDYATGDSKAVSSTAQ